MVSQPRIAIIGAGPSGLTLGLLLHQADVPVTIFELRDRPTEEQLAKPSGMLDLHEESGLEAIRACGLFDQFLLWTNECGKIMRILDKNGNPTHVYTGIRYRPEISRHALIRLLLFNIPENIIKWARKLISASVAETGKTTLDFGPHGVETFDFVVGADGAWSRIRPILSSAKPEYIGLQNLTLTIPHITTRHPHLAELCGNGSIFILGARNAVIGHRGTRNSQRLFLTINTPDEHFALTEGLSDMRDTQQLKDWLTDDSRMFRTWGELTKELIAVACDDHAVTDGPNKLKNLDIKPLYMLPIGHQWEPRRGVTAIGDAAHLMSPYAGEGVNLAMWDALELSRAISEAWRGSPSGVDGFYKTLAPLLREAEKAMFKRAEKKARRTWENFKVIFAEDAAERLAATMKRLSQGPLNK